MNGGADSWPSVDPPEAEPPAVCPDKLLWITSNATVEHQVSHFLEDLDECDEPSASADARFFRSGSRMVA